MDAKKISFGFSKVAKKPNILPSKVAKEEKSVELIKCLEGKEIKLVAEKQEAEPLVIHMLTNQKTSTALASLLKRRAVLLGEDEPEPEESTSEPQTIAEVTTNGDISNLEERAARELIAAAQANGSEVVEGEKLVLPALKADELPLEGARQSNMDDYEAIPIQQFGLAMLRGMGWVDPPPASKKKGVAPVEEAPFVRPKGMGLGADKALRPNALLVQPEQNEVLEIKKQAFVRILGGKHKDQYGQIEGFDDHAGRVIVKMAIGGAKEAFNEFLCQPISRKEYTQYGKCINTAKYQEYKKQENEHGQIIIKREPSKERTKSEHRHGQREKERQSYKDDERKSYKDEDRKSYKDDERKSYKDEERKSYKDDERKSYKDEDRKSYKDEDRKSYNNEERKSYKDEDLKSHRTEQKNAKLENQQTENKDYKTTNNNKSKDYKQEDCQPYKSEHRNFKREERQTENRGSKEDHSKYKREEQENKGRDLSHESRQSRRHEREQNSQRSSGTSKSSNRRRQESSADDAEDTEESSESDDSAYERKKKKKSERSRKSKKSKSKKSKSKSHRHRSSSSSSDDSDNSADELERRHHSKHKRKSKKSKHVRSRTRSRSRERRTR